MTETIPDFLAHLSSHYRHRPALQIRRFLKTTKVSYLELESLSKRIACYLHNLGLRPGNAVLVWAPNMPEWVLALFGSLTLGIVVVPVNLHSTSEVVGKYIDQTKPKAILLSKFFPTDLKTSRGKRLKKIYLEDLADIAEETELKGLPKISRKELAEIVFTSGTTGEPKGVMITHHNILYELEEILKTIPRDPAYRLLSILPLSHIMEQVGLFVTLARGGTIYYLPRINLVTIQKALRKYHITHLALVPQMLRMFLDNIEYQAAQQGKEKAVKFLLKIGPLFSMSIRRLLFREIHENLGGKLSFFGVASAPLDLHLAKAWEALGVKVMEGYGASETTGAVTDNRIKKRKLGSAGQRLPGIEVKISPEGEILTKGDNVTQGYFHNDEKTKESFTSDRYFKTGDIGHFDKKGYLYITGREKFKIITAAGDKIYPEDVERKINAHPDVWDSCVVGLKKGNDEIAHAYVILKGHTKSHLEAIIQKINSTLEPHQQITSFSLWPEKDFPRLHTLKVDRNAVKNFLESKNVAIPLEQGSDQTGENKLKELVGRVCRLPANKVKPESLLVRDLGLDSLKRVELVSLIEEEFAVEVDEATIDTTMTYHKLFSLVHTQKSHPAADRRLEQVVTLLRQPWDQNLKVLCQNLIMFPSYRLFVKTKVESAINLNAMSHPTIFVGNHRTTAAVASFLQALPHRFRKRLLILADDRYWRDRAPFLGNDLVISCAGAIPIDKRGGPVGKSLELVADFVEDNYSIIILPEGANTPENKLLGEIHPGLEVLFSGTKIPMIPFFVSKNITDTFDTGRKWPLSEFIPRGVSHVTLKIGQPFTLKGVSESRATNFIRDRILELA